MAYPEVLPIPPAPEHVPQAEAPVEAPNIPETPSQAQPQHQQQPVAQQAQPTAPATPPATVKADDATLVVPLKNNEELEALVKGDASDAKTWFGVLWIFRIKKALHSGLRAVFGGQ